MVRETDEDPWIEVVGVVGDVVHLDENVPSVPQIYLAFAQSPTANMSVIARAGGDPSALADPLRALALSLEPDASVQTRTLSDLRREVFAGADAVVALFAIFAGFALAMASMGIYGVMSYSVSQRERELGIRMALGADRNEVTRTVAAQKAKLVALGALAGLVGAALLGRMLSGVILEVSLFDPATFWFRNGNPGRCRVYFELGAGAKGNKGRSHRDPESRVKPSFPVRAEPEIG